MYVEKRIKGEETERAEKYGWREETIKERDDEEHRR